jgi:hypothetical protein
MTAVCHITACRDSGVVQPTGEICDACDTRITKEQLVMEGIASTHTDEKSIQFHVKCFYVWDAERLRAIAPPRDSTFAADIPALALI